MLPFGIVSSDLQLTKGPPLKTYRREAECSRIQTGKLLAENIIFNHTGIETGKDEFLDAGILTEQYLNKGIVSRSLIHHMISISGPFYMINFILSLVVRKAGN